MPTVLQQETVPEDLRDRTTLDRYDYVDVFTMSTDTGAVRWPEYWARAAIEGAAGFKGQFVWRGVLGLRLEARPENIAGWSIADSGDSWITLDAASRLLAAQLVIEIKEGAVTVGTFVRHDNPVASVVWSVLSNVHRRAMPGLLRRTARIVAERKSR